MLEGSDAKTEIVRGLLLPSPMTVYGPGVGEPAFSPTVGCGGGDGDGGEAWPSREPQMRTG